MSTVDAGAEPVLGKPGIRHDSIIRFSVIVPYCLPGLDPGSMYR